MSILCDKNYILDTAKDTVPVGISPTWAECRPLRNASLIPLRNGWFVIV